MFTPFVFFRVEAPLPIPTGVAHARMLTRLAGDALQEFSVTAHNCLREIGRSPRPDETTSESLLVLTGTSYRRGNTTVLPLRWQMRYPSWGPDTAEPVLDANLELLPLDSKGTRPTTSPGPEHPASALVLVGVYRSSDGEMGLAATYNQQVVDVLAQTFLHDTARLITAPETTTARFG